MVALYLSKPLSFSLFFFVCFTTSLSDDISSLLSFKYSADTSSVLTSWSSHNESCSSWLGVTCHPVTRRVTKLVLNGLNLSGTIHHLFELDHLRHLSLHHNFLTTSSAEIETASNFNLGSSWPSITHVYLSHNNFSGEFPRGVGRLRRLRRLDLSYNEFSGEVPVAELRRLPHLLTLRLEFNEFNGSLGDVEVTAGAATFSDFNVSGNDFSGKIPNWLSKFPVASFAGNVHLCGYPLRSMCPNETVASYPTTMSISPSQLNLPNKGKKNLSEKMFLLIATVDAVAVMMTVLIVTWCCYYKKKNKQTEIYNKVMKNNKNFLFLDHSSGSSNFYHSFEYGVKSENMMVIFEGCKKGFKRVDELLKSSAEMLGKGCVGTSYKVKMDGGDLLVVKRVVEKLKRMKGLDGLLRLIGGLRHPSVVPLRAYYCSKDELLLVYDFLPNGSLHNLLHGNRGPGRTPLDWTTRLKYALGAAKGLAFLHSFNKTKLYHGNLTSTNILIDQHGNACISDACLHSLLQHNTNDTTQTPRKSSQKSDVYGFGVVLLEILTGKVATREGELEKWVQRVVKNNEWTWDVFDFELARYKEMEDEMVALLKVAMACLAISAKDRPKMVMVEKMIEDIGKREKRGRKIESFSTNSYTSVGESSQN